MTGIIELAVAIGGGGLIALAIKNAKRKGWAGSLQMAAGGFLLMGAAAIGVVGFLAGVVLNPLAWLGIVSLGIAAALFAIGQRLDGRGSSRAVDNPSGAKRDRQTSTKSGGSAKAVESRKLASGVDSELAEIEEILRKHGIE